MKPRFFCCSGSKSQLWRKSRRESILTEKRRFRLFSRSTRAWIAEARRTKGYSLFDLLHGYVYTRWPYLYIGVATGAHPLARWVAPILGPLSNLIITQAQKAAKTGQVSFADTYHGKVMPVESAKRLIEVKQPIRFENLETIIPYQRAQDIILEHPDHIVVLECPCRASRANPCLPLDVCLIVGEPFASFVLEHHPNHSRPVAQQEAADIIQAEHKRGHVHHAFFKDAMLGRYYAICNCCACCCGAMQAQRNGVPMLESSGYINQVDASRCQGCGACAEVCPFDAIAIRDGVSTVDAARCMGCGACIDRCGHGALSLVRDPDRSTPLEIQTLLEQAA
ncbi:MAG: 4Fe-4S binding protein [Anaerolineae bacterium]|nr:4Fe-4S binding protein [Anaerolineae bacterium]